MKKQRKVRRPSLEDRTPVEACLHKGMNMSEMASRLRVHMSTVSREIRNNSVRKEGLPFPCPRRANGLCNTCPPEGLIQ